MSFWDMLLKTLMFKDISSYSPGMDIFMAILLWFLTLTVLGLAGAAVYYLVIKPIYYKKKYILHTFNVKVIKKEVEHSTIWVSQYNAATKTTTMVPIPKTDYYLTLKALNKVPYFLNETFKESVSYSFLNAVSEEDNLVLTVSEKQITPRFKEKEDYQYDGYSIDKYNKI